MALGRYRPALAVVPVIAHPRPHTAHLQSMAREGAHDIDRKGQYVGWHAQFGAARTRRQRLGAVGEWVQA